MLNNILIYALMILTLPVLYMAVKAFAASIVPINGIKERIVSIVCFILCGGQTYGLIYFTSYISQKSVLQIAGKIAMPEGIILLMASFLFVLQEYNSDQPFTFDQHFMNWVRVACGIWMIVFSFITSRPNWTEEKIKMYLQRSVLGLFVVFGCMYLFTIWHIVLHWFTCKKEKDIKACVDRILEDGQTVEKMNETWYKVGPYEIQLRTNSLLPSKWRYDVSYGMSTTILAGLKTLDPSTVKSAVEHYKEFAASMESNGKLGWTYFTYDSVWLRKEYKARFDFKIQGENYHLSSETISNRNNFTNRELLHYFPYQKLEKLLCDIRDGQISDADPRVSPY